MSLEELMAALSTLTPQTRQMMTEEFSQAINDAREDLKEESDPLIRKEIATCEYVSGVMLLTLNRVANEVKQLKEPANAS